MKTIFVFSLSIVIALTATSCDSSDESAKLESRLRTLEQENSEAVERERRLEMELVEEKLLAERDLIERERKLTEEVRYALELEGEATEEEVKGLLEREGALADRELLLEGRQNEHFERFYAWRSKGLEVSDADLALAGKLVAKGASWQDPDQDVEVADFYQDLSAYGSWYESDEYGEVWQPAVACDSSWRPYSRGRWACSDRGWVWISDEPFGWATYHYGRWVYIGGGCGWVWIPGTEWAPSWCSWRMTDVAIGWAPLPPGPLSRRVQDFDSSVDPYLGGGGLGFTFVKAEDFDQPISRVGMSQSEAASALKSSRDVTRYDRSRGAVFAGGPGYLDLSERMGRRMPYYRIDRQPAQASAGKPVRAGSRARGERLVVTASKIRTEARKLSRPVRVRGSVESYRAPTRPRMQPRVEIVEPQPIALTGGDDDIDARMVETLMPDLPEKSMEAGFPVEEMEAEKVIMPELREAALKPKPVVVAEEGGESKEGGAEQVANREPGESGGAEGEPASSSEESSNPSSPVRESSQPVRETRAPEPAPPSRPQSQRSGRSSDEVEEGKNGPRSR